MPATGIASDLTLLAVVVLGTLFYFQRRLVRVPAASVERQLIDSLKGLLETQLIEIDQLKRRVDTLERYKVAFEVMAEQLAKHAPEMVQDLNQRMRL